MTDVLQWPGASVSAINTDSRSIPECYGRDSADTKSWVRQKTHSSDDRLAHHCAAVNVSSVLQQRSMGSKGTLGLLHTTALRHSLEYTTRPRCIAQLTVQLSSGNKSSYFSVCYLMFTHHTRHGRSSQVHYGIQSPTHCACRRTTKTRTIMVTL